MKILISVLTYLDGGIYENFYHKQNETWNSIDVDDVDTFFYIGGGEKKEIRNHFSINDLPETVPNEAYKLLNFFNQTLEWDYDYIYHTNSSSYVDKKLLVEWLSTKPKTGFYSGVVGNYHGHLFASGCGFTISKDVVKLILKHQNEWTHGMEDDATLGILLKKYGIDVYPAPRLDIDYNNFNNISNDYFHYRCKTNNRVFDIENMGRIHNNKLLGAIN